MRAQIARLVGDAFVLAVGATVASTAFVVIAGARAVVETVTLTRRVRELREMVDGLEGRFETVYAEHEAAVDSELSEMLGDG